MLFGMELMNCPAMAVPAEVMQHVVRVESSYNPYAIGVVGGQLARQPKNLPEALATVRMLEGRGFNFSLGLAQVNRYNLAKYGLDSYEKAFETCPNLQAGSRILAECYGRSGGDWGKSFSCYYSGNFVTGYRHGYVQKIYASMRGAAPKADEVPPIEVVGKASRKTADVARYPVHAQSRSSPVQQRIVINSPQPAVTVPALPASEPAVMATDTAGVATASPAVVQLSQLQTPVPAITQEAKPAQDSAFVF